MLDTLIKKAKIVDGTGNPWFRGDIGIKGNIITALGTVDEAAHRVIEADHLVASPGFIDIHTHSDTTLPVNPLAESKIHQGVTTEVVGNCGNSSAPVLGAAAEDMRVKFSDLGLDSPWQTLAEFFSFMEGIGCAVNVAALIGHGTVRKSVVGFDDRPATEDELSQMERMMDEGMRHGAFGVSTGLIYPPGCFTPVSEIIRLAKTVHRHGGIYVSHIRNEGADVLTAGAEAIHIGRTTGIPVEWSHVKAAGSAMWGNAPAILALMDNAISENIDVSGDVYPYEATSTGLSMFLPKWAHDGGKTALLARLRDPDQRESLTEGILKIRMTRGTWDKIFIATVTKPENVQYQGLSIEAIAHITGQPPVDVVINLLASENGEVSMVSFAMDEADIDMLYRHPLIMVGSDGNSLSPQGVLGNGKPHPRHYGTFPRILAHYVRDRQILSLEEAVRKMTGLPAWRLGLRDRGLIAPGMKADITLFDQTRVKDTATYQDPHRFPDGIDYVLVNGSVVIDSGRHTKTLVGKMLRKNT